MQQTWTIVLNGPKKTKYNTYIKEALKSFRRIYNSSIFGDNVMFFCDVDQLDGCNELGSDEEITAWRRRLLLRTRFNTTKGIIFSRGPGGMFVDTIKNTTDIDDIYIMLDENTIINCQTGDTIDLESPLVLEPKKE